MSGILSKSRTYLKACLALRSVNLEGLPILPKRVFTSLPYNREHYNEFVIWLRRIGLPKAQLILDVGANHADFASAASAVYPDAEVWLFEPLPSLHEELARRAKPHGQKWKIRHQALGARRATLELHMDPARDDIASLLGFNESYRENTHSADQFKKSTCEVVTLDEFFLASSHDMIDVLKVDVEGFEFEALTGARESLKKTQAAIIEVSLMRAGDREGSRLIRMLEMLEEAGLRPVEVFPSWFSKSQPWLPVEFNILARRDA